MIDPNAYFVVALAGVLVVEAVDAVGEVLNLRRLTPELPAEFASGLPRDEAATAGHDRRGREEDAGNANSSDICATEDTLSRRPACPGGRDSAVRQPPDLYDQDSYAKSQRYTREKTRFGFWSAGFDLAVLLAFWLASGFGWLDGILRGLDIGPVPTGLLFFVALMAAKSVLDLPFGIYTTFVIEERYGFNRTSGRTFVLDLVRGALVSAVIGLPLLAAFLAIFIYLGWYAWLVAWAVVAAATLVLQVIVPTFILPLFNRFTPLEEGELRSAIFAYAERAHFPLKAVYSVDASRRSSHGNAYFTGVGKSKRIALFDTIIERHPIPELVAVLAHEIGHYRKRHVLMTTAVGIVEMGLYLGLFAVFSRQEGLSAAFGFSQPSVYAGLISVAVLLRLLQFVLSVGGAALSRRNERQADAFAASTTDGGAALADGLARLSKDSLSNLTPHPFYVLLNYSHPPVLERLRALRGADRSRADRPGSGIPNSGLPGSGISNSDTASGSEIVSGNASSPQGE